MEDGNKDDGSKGIVEDTEVEEHGMEGVVGIDQAGIKDGT